MVQNGPQINIFARNVRSVSDSTIASVRRSRYLARQPLTETTGVGTFSTGRTTHSHLYSPLAFSQGSVEQNENAAGSMPEVCPLTIMPGQTGYGPRRGVHMSTPTTAADIFALMRETLAHPSSWTKGFVARDAAGNQCLSTDPKAVSWCLYGARNLALSRVKDADLRDQLEDETDELLHEAAGGAAPSAINDDRSTTHEQLLQLIASASRKA